MSMPHSLKDGYIIPPMFDQEGGWIGFRSLRRCPVPNCETTLITNGNGEFRCETCGFEDKQEVDSLRKKGLDYPAKNRLGEGMLFGAKEY